MTLLRLVSLMLFVGCTGTKDSATDGTTDDTGNNSADADTDADTDSDTDADADTDTDTDTDADADCSSVPICGGDPTGLWNATQVCADTTERPMGGCDGGYVKVLDTSMTGTLEFSSDASYSVDIATMTVTMLYHFPAECIPSMTCAEVEAEESPPGSTCVEVADGCDCTSVQTDSGFPEEGTWSVSGTDVSMETTSGDENVLPFCVDGNDLWLSPPPSGGAPFSMLFTK